MRQKSEESVRASKIISRSKHKDFNKLNTDQIRWFDKDLFKKVKFEKHKDSTDSYQKVWYEKAAIAKVGSQSNEIGQRKSNPDLEYEPVITSAYDQLFKHQEPDIRLEKNFRSLPKQRLIPGNSEARKSIDLKNYRIPQRSNLKDISPLRLSLRYNPIQRAESVEEPRRI